MFQMAVVEENGPLWVVFQAFWTKVLNILLQLFGGIERRARVMKPSDIYFHNLTEYDPILPHRCSCFFLTVLLRGSKIQQGCCHQLAEDEKTAGVSQRFYFFLVPKEGLEPSHLAAHAPETCVSTNFTTSAEHLVFLTKRSFFGAQDWTRTSTPCGTTPSK